MIKSVGVSLPLKPHNQFQWNSILQTRSHTTLLGIYIWPYFFDNFQEALEYSWENWNNCGSFERSGEWWLVLCVGDGGVWSNIQKLFAVYIADVYLIPTCNWSILKRWSLESVSRQFKKQTKVFALYKEIKLYCFK